ncbi:hypothetical protein GCM10022235_82070 [Kribbella ginsengisoli]|uniref:Uncharacterized protein n=1 Tax=Kribbella ginsengisoli TaxID=363865 RepID=A0ABP6Z645_9ACTN
MSIPRQTVGFKEYAHRCGPVSKMSDKDEAAASVGYSETASVQHPPGTVHPELGQVPEDRAEVCSVVDREKARDVLADEPTGM